MDAALRRDDANTVPRWHNTVSILVLMDAALRPNGSVADAATVRVSILVLMDAALRRFQLIRNHRQEWVSMLVLIDAALRRHLNHQY